MPMHFVVFWSFTFIPLVALSILLCSLLLPPFLEMCKVSSSLFVGLAVCCTVHGCLVLGRRFLTIPNYEELLHLLGVQKL